MLISNQKAKGRRFILVIHNYFNNLWHLVLHRHSTFYNLGLFNNWVVQCQQDKCINCFNIVKFATGKVIMLLLVFNKGAKYVIELVIRLQPVLTETLLQVHLCPSNILFHLILSSFSLPILACLSMYKIISCLVILRLQT